MREREEIAKLSFIHNVSGFICGNVTKNRKLNTIKDIDVADVGGMSGMVVQNCPMS
jgi:dihydroorotate dehydrogenase